MLSEEVGEVIASHISRLRAGGDGCKPKVRRVLTRGLGWVGVGRIRKVFSTVGKWRCGGRGAYVNFAAFFQKTRCEKGFSKNSPAKKVSFFVESCFVSANFTKHACLSVTKMLVFDERCLEYFGRQFLTKDTLCTLN